MKKQPCGIAHDGKTENKVKARILCIDATNDCFAIECFSLTDAISYCKKNKGFKPYIETTTVSYQEIPIK